MPIRSDNADDVVVLACVVWPGWFASLKLDQYNHNMTASSDTYFKYFLYPPPNGSRIRSRNCILRVWRVYITLLGCYVSPSSPVATVPRNGRSPSRHVSSPALSYASAVIPLSMTYYHRRCLPLSQTRSTLCFVTTHLCIASLEMCHERSFRMDVHYEGAIMEVRAHNGSKSPFDIEKAFADFKRPP